MVWRIVAKCGFKLARLHRSPCSYSLVFQEISLISCDRCDFDRCNSDVD